MRHGRHLSCAFVQLIHFPLVDAGGEVGRELHDQPQGGRLDRGKAHGAPLVLGDRVGLGGRDGLPVALVQVFDLPRGRQPALAAAGVIEPIDPRAADLHRRLPGVLGPFLGAFVRPPVAQGGRLLAAALRLQAVVDALRLAVVVGKADGDLGLRLQARGRAAPAARPAARLSWGPAWRLSQA